MSAYVHSQKEVIKINRKNSLGFSPRIELPQCRLGRSHFFKKDLFSHIG